MASNRVKRSAQSDGAAAMRTDGLARMPPETDDAYLADLGARVRRIRAIRGMSRKVLAQTSGISERYIAQLEAGAGNVSVILLRRIAGATGVRIEDLVGQQPAAWTTMRDLLQQAPPEAIAQARAILTGASKAANPGAGGSGRTPRIALVGLRGAGKSTLGRTAAELLDIGFLELNQVIESHHGLSVTEIFKLYGQEGYRRLELDALRRIVASNDPVILATGGGIVAEAVTYDLLRANFFTIWIKAKPEEHMNRVRRQGDLRPMANDRAAMHELVTILSSREPLYALADARIDTSGRMTGECAAELAATIRERFPALEATA